MATQQPLARDTRPAVLREVEDVLHVGRRQHRHGAGREQVLALVRRAGRARRVVVAGHHQHAAVRGGAGEVGVLEDVGAAVHARALAVPHREDAVARRRASHGRLGALGQQAELLRAPHGGGGQVLVHRRPEAHVVRVERGLRLVQRGVQAAQRRAAVAGDEAGGGQAAQTVGLALQQRRAHERLHAAEQQPVAVRRQVGRVTARTCGHGVLLTNFLTNGPAASTPA